MITNTWPSASVVIPSYNRKALLAPLLDKLLIDPGTDEVIVVIDGSADGSMEYLRGKAQQDSRVVAVWRENSGIAASRQAGLERAKGDIVVVLDDDILPGPQLVQKHKAKHVATSDATIVLGYMPNVPRRVKPANRPLAEIYRRAYENACDRYEKEPEHVLLGFWAGNFSAPREALKRIGFFNEGFKLLRGQQDREFGIRCYEADLSGTFDRTLAAEHLYDRDISGFRRDAYLSGMARQLIHDLHPHLVGSTLNTESSATGQSVDMPGKALPPFLRRFLPTLASSPVYPSFTNTVERIYSGLTRKESSGLGFKSALFAAKIIGTIETQRGVQQHLRNSSRFISRSDVH